MAPVAIDAPASSFALLKETVKGEAAGATFNSKPQTLDNFVKHAERVAEILAVDVAERDARNEVPQVTPAPPREAVAHMAMNSYKQVALLKEAGLVTALGPAKFGGGGLTFSQGYKLQRIVSRGDGSVGQLLAYHYLWRQVSRPESIKARRTT